jgi:REP element-mobilizing transposase RayT
MAQPLSIEAPEKRYLITTRTSGSRLWFINNPALEEKILGCLARYREIHEVIIFGFILMGNHYHLLAQFPKGNRAAFMRDFNSATARIIGRYVSEHGRRSVWARRYSKEELPRDEDLMHWFFYLALNPVSSGLLPSINAYPSYNSFFDAIEGRVRTFRWIDWSKYLLKKRHNPNVTPDDFAKEYELSYTRLPNLKELSEAEYKSELLGRLEERTHDLVKERRENGKGFLGLKLLKRQRPGARPKNTKISHRYSFRPLVLTLCRETRSRVLEAYFAILDKYKKASKAFRSGELSADFPRGCYSPQRFVTL